MLQQQSQPVLQCQLCTTTPALLLGALVACYYNKLLLLLLWEAVYGRMPGCSWLVCPWTAEFIPQACCTQVAPCAQQRQVGPGQAAQRGSVSAVPHARALSGLPVAPRLPPAPPAAAPPVCLRPLCGGLTSACSKLSRADVPGSQSCTRCARQAVVCAEQARCICQYVVWCRPYCHHTVMRTWVLTPAGA
jgi:hypothetical protein